MKVDLNEPNAFFRRRTFAAAPSFALLVLAACCGGGETTPPGDAGLEIEVSVDPMADPVEGGGDPMDETDGSCSPVGSTRTVTPCGPCGGNLQQICTLSGWFDDGVCVGGGICSPGALETQSCGTGGCGSQSRACGAACNWTSWGTCVEPSVIECSPPGTVEVTRAGCAPGMTQRRACSATCSWTAVDPCSTACLSPPMGIGTYAEEICIPGGDFYQGGADGTSTSDDPEHVVTLYPFLIERWEVTNGRYRECVTAGACTLPSPVPAEYTTQDRYPIITASWAQAAAFCAWEGKRLPTESEWEKAGRGPFPIRARYPWGDAPPTCAEARTSVCGTYGNVDDRPGGASPFGVEMMDDGALEFVQDWYDAAYYAVSPSVDPRGPASGSSGHVERGGGASFPAATYPAITQRMTEGIWGGIRCARSVEAR